MKKHVQIPVKVLVEHLYRKGDISFSFGQASKLSGRQGIRFHQKIQNSRPSSYLAEVAVSYRTEGTHIILDVNGRIDGMYEKENQIVIEEIKTTQKELDSFIQEHNILHWAQVKIYAAIFAYQKNLKEVQLQMTYIQVESGEIKTLIQSFHSDELEIFLRTSLEKYMDWLDNIEIWRRERDLQIAQANFPYRSFREGQMDMILDIQNTIKHQEQLIIQAPTGIGKTVAALYPAIKALAENFTQKIFYLTARTTGRKIAEKTLFELGAKGLKIKSITLTAKEKICFNPGKNCSGEECIFARGYYDRLPEAREIIFKHDIFTMENIQAIARDFNLCPFELSLDLSLWVDCVICDINYAFDPRVYLRRYFLSNYADYTFLVDEAHNLVDRSREMFSAELSRFSFLKLRRTLKNKKTKLYLIAGQIGSKLKAMQENLAEGENFQWEKEKPDELLPLFRRLCFELESWILSHPQSAFSQEWLDLFFSTNWFLNVADIYDENYVTCLEKKEDGLRLKLFCIDPSDQLRAALGRAKSVVLFSATITPISYFAQILGCQESITKRILPSPFPSQNLCLCIANSISTLYRNREATKDSLTRTIGTFVDQKKGNYFVFFPSYEYMHMILPLYAQSYPHHEILVQKSGMTEEERLNFLDNFARENSRTLAGFVVMGGIFGEAIDLSGDRLSGAAVVGVGLPGISPERELIKSYFLDHNEPGFNYAYLYPGLNRVLQAAGRVIRTEKDRGAVLLIDSRFTRLQYISLFPREWQARRVTNTNQMKRVLQQFWNNNL